jgi:tRNA pseudouridine55 synthase
VKSAERAVSGILLLDKPAGISSNRALQLAKRLYRAAKAGHTGSLDPLATGLLPICFGEATKIAGYLLGSRKAYAAQCRLGTTTTTDDAEGEVVLLRPVPETTDATIEAALATLRGHIVQTPPAYSAIKQAGVPLYKRARRGEDVVVPPREVDVERFDLCGRNGDALDLHVECGSGTYVRSLVRDLGERLGCGAHLTALRRLWVEPFRDPAMHTLDELERIAADGGTTALDRLLLPLEAGLGGLPALTLSDTQAQRLRHGQCLNLPGQESLPLCRALDARGRLVALVRQDADGTVAILRGFAATD